MNTIAPDFKRHSMPREKKDFLRKIHDSLTSNGFESHRADIMGFDTVVYTKPFSLNFNGRELQGNYEINIGLRQGHPGMVKMFAQRDKMPGEKSMYERSAPITGRGFTYVLEGTPEDMNKKFTAGVNWLRQCKEGWSPSADTPAPPAR